jgi:cathepsin B
MLFISLTTLALAPAPAEVHPERKAQIAEILAAKPSWTPAAHPRFAAEAPGASATLMGVLGDWGKDIAEQIGKGEMHPYTSRLLRDEDIPDAFDSEENWPQCAGTIGLIRDQSNCGCCWAFAGVEAASDRMCIATNASILLPISSENVCFCASWNGCGGGQISTPWTYIKRHGAVTGGLYGNSKGQPTGFSGMCSDYSLPHCHHHGPKGDDPYPSEGEPGCESQKSPRCPRTCDDDSASPHDDFSEDKHSFGGRIESASGEAEIQKMIMEGGPVETAFTVYSDFENYAGGIYHHVSGTMAGGHAVKFVGWGVEGGQKYWKVQNSWNPFWGEKGYFRIVRGQNEGGIESAVVGSSASATWGKKSALLSSLVDK